MAPGLDDQGGDASPSLSFFLESPAVALSCLIGTICPITGCLTPAQPLHMRAANYRRSGCSALAHELKHHGGRTVHETTFVCVLTLWRWLIVFVLGPGTCA